MKICKLCGEDCSTRPRVKDSKGSYYCKTCHAAAVEQRQQRESAAAAHVEPPPPAPGGSEASAGDEVSLLDEILTAAPPEQATEPDSKCPSCGHPLPLSALICTNCGYNLQSGGAVGTKIHSERSLPTGAAASLLMSPMALGIIAMGMFAILFITGTQSETMALAFLGVYAAFGFAVSIWALIVAFMEGILHGIVSLCIGIYLIYVVYALNENSYLKWLFGAYLLATPGYIYLLMMLGAFDQGGYTFTP